MHVFTWKLPTSTTAETTKTTTQQTDWEKYINEEFTKEVNRAARQNDQLNFENAAVKAFQRVGIFINPDWLFNYTITGNTIQNIVELETIWDSIQRTIQQENCFFP